MKDQHYVQSEAMTQAPAPSGRSAGVRIALGVMGLAVLGLAVIVGVRVKEATTQRDSVAKERDQVQAAAGKRAPSKRIAPVPVRFRPKVDFTGTLKPWRDADLGFEAGGKISRILVSTGDVVRAGAVLALLDATRAGAQVNQADSQIKAAEAGLAMAEDNLKRTEALAATKSIADAQVEQARQQVALSKAQLEGARAGANLARTGAGNHSIIAPFQGVVTRAPTGIGGVVGPGTPLIHLEDTSRLRLSATVGEEDVPLVGVGGTVAVRYRDRTVSGKVIALVPSLDQATRRAPLEIEVPNDQAQPLLAWSFVRATLTANTEVDGLRVPREAQKPGSQDEVVKLDGKTARVVRVVHSVDEDGSWIIRSGLAATDQVVLSPPPDIRDGDVLEFAAP